MTVNTKAKTFKAWMVSNLGKDTIRDIAEHGANVGFPGLTYYSDTESLHDLFKEEIWDALNDDAESFGQTIAELVASFNGAKDVGSLLQFKNLLAWYMAERIAHEMNP